MRLSGSSNALLICLFAFLGCASDEPIQATSSPNSTDAREILQKVFEKYRHASSYEDKGRFEVSYTNEQGTTVDGTDFAISYEAPNRFRVRFSRADVRFDVVSDGQQLVAWIEDRQSDSFEGQVVLRPSPDRMTIASVYSAGEFANPDLPSELHSVLAAAPIHPELTQLGLLQASAAFDNLVQKYSAIELLESATTDEASCHRVSVKTSAGNYIFWIDQSSSILHRLEYPAGNLFAGSPHHQQPQDVTLVANFDRARINEQIDSTTFQADINPNAKRLRHFVLPPPEIPIGRLGKPIRDYSFASLDGGRIESKHWRDRPVVLVWFRGHQVCQDALLQVQHVKKHLLKAVPAEFLAVCTESRTALSHSEVRAMLRQWDVDLPCARDLDAVGRDLFDVADAPTVVIVGADQRIHLYEVGAGLDLITSVSTVLERLSRGDDVAADVIKREAEAKQRFRRQLAVASVDAPSTAAAPVRTEVAPRSDPKVLKLTELWHCQDVKSPGNLMFAKDARGEQLLVVIENWKSVAFINADGSVVDRADLELPDGAAITELQPYTAGSNTYFAAAAEGAQHAFIYNDQWKKIGQYPASDQPAHAGLSDILLADLDGDGEPELYAGFHDVIGVHRVTLAGSRQWSNRNVAGVLSLAATVHERPSLLVTGESGLISRIDAEGKSGRDISVGRRAIHGIVATNSKSPRATAYCGLSYGVDGSLIAAGLDTSLEEAWSYPLPVGVYLNQVTVAQSVQLLPDRWQWLFAGSNGSIHLVSEDGSFSDFVNLGEHVSGLTSSQWGGRAVLVVSTAAGVRAFRVSLPKS